MPPCVAHMGCTNRENPQGIFGYHPLPWIALGSSGPSMQPLDATSMQTPATTSVEAQLLLQAEGLMTWSSGTSGSAPNWAIWDIIKSTRCSISAYIFPSC
jgi:hypothetical protein